MIKIEKVSKVYPNGTIALENLTFDIKAGEFVFVVGASGSGKSTIVKLILKEEEATSGEIFVSGINLSKMQKKDIPYYRRTMGVVFQDFRIIENMTVFENVAFAMRIIGAKPRNIRKRVPYVLGLFSLEDKADRYPCELSGGEKQRVGIARALVNNPRLVIADEPTGNIDSSMSYEIIELLSQINRRGTTVIVVTHDLSIVEKFPFRIVELFCGKVRTDTKNHNSFSEFKHV
ncbi:MAG: cell division ATP-binding protein FtsE [Firmicutes bacterium]|nr:cell division ATP-binding protein FtsE [Bacillota bacterium]